MSEGSFCVSGTRKVRFSPANGNIVDLMSVSRAPKSSKVIRAAREQEPPSNSSRTRAGLKLIVAAATIGINTVPNYDLITTSYMYCTKNSDSGPNFSLWQSIKIR